MDTMRHVQSLEELNLQKPAFVTVGVFDGVHRGHQSLIGGMAEAAHAAGNAAVVVTFHPHPAEVLRGHRPSFYLNRPEEKAALIGALGVDWVVTHPFNLEVSQISAAAFVDRLIAHANMTELWAGHDFALGHNREGTIAFLQALGEAQGFRVRVVEPYRDGGEIVSSSAVRAALGEGQVERAAEYLGRLYSLSGKVVEGARRGRTIGVPTANIEIWQEQAYPAFGVYACWAWVDGERRPAATNIGVRPTFEETGLPTIEAHLIDYNGDLYGREMRLEFAARLRAELKFDGIEALVAQIKADVEQTRRLLVD
jgi:riboflavin kinase / FMN adenylyltransferase